MIKMSDLLSTRKIHFTCANCRTKYFAQTEQAGKEGKCKNCGEKIVVPQSDENNLLSESYAVSETQSNSI